MILGENSIRETYYDILSVKEDASYDEIRSSYRSAILHSHPDKLNNSSQSSRCYSPDDRFLKIQKAWEVLGNAKSRAIYDNDLWSSREDAVTADEISVEDMMVAGTEEEEVLELYYQCRCGDYFSIDSSELGKMGYKLMRDGGYVCFSKPGTVPASVLLPCGSCSLKIRMWVDSDIMIPLQDDPS